MKGKLSKAMMVAMMLVTVFGLAASLATTVSSTTTVSAAVDKWSRMDLPTTLNYQMFPDSTVWDITGAADGTLFALVEDTTHDTAISDPVSTCSAAGAVVWDGLRWAVYPAYSDIAVFKSTNGGCSWELCWHVPSSEDGAPIAVVPQPGYVDSDSSKDTVFVAMGARYIGATQGGAFTGYSGPTAAPIAGSTGVGNIYRSENGCDSFTRVTPRCPGVIVGGSITSMDIVECSVCTTGCQNPFMAIVGVTSLSTSTGGVGGFGEGVYTWNQNGVAIWNDLMISNSMQAPPTPGNMVAGWGLDVIQVYGSRNYPTDGCIVAVVNDLIAGDPATEVPGVYVCFYDANDGIWGGDIDSPTNAARTDGAGGVVAPINWDNEEIGAAAIDTGTDFNSITACYVFVGFEGALAANTAANSNEDLFRIRGLSTVTGPSTSTNCNVRPLLSSTGAVTAVTDDVHLSDVMINGEVSNPSTRVYVGCEYPEGQAQVLSVTNAVNWPSPAPSFKPCTGAWPVLVTDAAGTVFASGDDAVDAAGTYAAAYTTGGVHKMYETSRGIVFNGIGLLDDIAVSEDIPGYLLDPATAGSDYSIVATDWCMVEAVSEEVSPLYDTDGLIYVATWSEWVHDLSLWRLTSGCWERIMYEDVRIPGNFRFDAKAMETTAVNFIFVNSDGPDDQGEIWWPKVVPQFSTDQSMFLLGGRSNWVDGPFGGSYMEMFWYSPDKGNDWRAFPQMPIGATNNVMAGAENGLSESGWVPVNSNHLLVGDSNGWIYRTDNRGASWTEGVLTGIGCEVNTIVVSPIYSIAGGTGTDMIAIAGTYDAGAYYDEVWISQDGCFKKDLENIGDEIYSWPMNWASTVPLGGTVVNFDKNWATNKIVYAAGGGWLDRWEMVGQGAGGNIDMNRIDYTDTSVVRTEVDLLDPSASTWKHLWDADDYSSVSPKPQTLTGMTLGNSVYRIALPSAIEIGADGTCYVTFSVWDSTYNNGNAGPFAAGDNPSPNPTSSAGRFTMGGVLRCLDAAEKDAEFEICQEGRGPWDGLWLNRAVPGSTHLISLTWDWKEWRFKLAFWEDTLSGAGPAVVAPLNGAQGVGALVADTSVNVPLSWQAKTSATQYEWQVSEDSAFTASNTKTGTTSDLTVTVLDLKPSTTYYWRTRALEPMLGRWSTAQTFTTVIGGDTGAPALITPEIGATIADETPLFTWEGIASATNYQIQVSTSPTFGAADIVIDEELGDVQAYEADKELVNGTYYWQVKGTNATTDTETPWSALGSFTLDTEAGGTGTPVWVWVLIVLGVLLGLVVLVLILRTRRPV